MVRNINREYATVINVPAPVSRIVQLDQSNRAVIITSSAIRLGSGGRPKLARLAKNHQVLMSGRII